MRDSIVDPDRLVPTTKVSFTGWLSFPFARFVS